MNTGSKRALYWTPRVLCILFALFLSIFALDVFGEGYSVWDTIVALFMHLIPVYMVIAALLVAWRWEWVGAVLFIALGVLYIAMAKQGSSPIPGQLSAYLFLVTDSHLHLPVVTRH